MIQLTLMLDSLAASQDDVATVRDDRAPTDEVAGWLDELAAARRGASAPRDVDSGRPDSPADEATGIRVPTVPVLPGSVPIATTTGSNPASGANAPAGLGEAVMITPPTESIPTPPVAPPELGASETVEQALPFEPTGRELGEPASTRPGVRANALGDGRVGHVVPDRSLDDDRPLTALRTAVLRDGASDRGALRRPGPSHATGETAANDARTPATADGPDRLVSEQRRPSTDHRSVRIPIEDATATKARGELADTTDRSTVSRDETTPIADARRRPRSGPGTSPAVDSVRIRPLEHATSSATPPAVERPPGDRARVAVDTAGSRARLGADAFDAPGQRENTSSGDVPRPAPVPAPDVTSRPIAAPDPTVTPASTRADVSGARVQGEILVPSTGVHEAPAARDEATQPTPRGVADPDSERGAAARPAITDRSASPAVEPTQVPRRAPAGTGTSSAADPPEDMLDGARSIARTAEIAAGADAARPTYSRRRTAPPPTISTAADEQPEESPSTSRLPGNVDLVPRGPANGTGRARIETDSEPVHDDPAPPAELPVEPEGSERLVARRRAGTTPDPGNASLATDRTASVGGRTAPSVPTSDTAAVAIGRESASVEARRTGSVESVRYTALAESIVARARAVPRNGSMEVRFALEPDDLGLVRVKIESRGDELRIRIVASSAHAADTLSSGVARLPTQMQDAGVRDATVDLSYEDATDSRDREKTGERQADDTREERGSSRASHAETSGPDARAHAGRRAAEAPGRLDRTA